MVAAPGRDDERAIRRDLSTLRDFLSDKDGLVSMQAIRSGIERAGLLRPYER